MKASKCSLEDIFRIGLTNKDLGMILSFVQVEYGLVELQGHWDGFSSASDNYGLSFQTKKHVAASFAEALCEYFELEEHEFEPTP